MKYSAMACGVCGMIRSRLHAGDRIDQTEIVFGVRARYLFIDTCHFGNVLVGGGGLADDLNGVRLFESYLRSVHPRKAKATWEGGLNLVCRVGSWILSVRLRPLG